MMIDNSLINWPEEKVEKLKAHYAEILSLLGEDPNREGLLKPQKEWPRPCLL